MSASSRPATRGLESSKLLTKLPLGDQKLAFPEDGSDVRGTGTFELLLIAFAEAALAKHAGGKDAASLQTHYESRLRDARAKRGTVPCDSIAHGFGLNRTARDLLLLLAAADLDPRLALVARAGHRDPQRGTLDCASAAGFLGRGAHELVPAMQFLLRRHLVRGGGPAAVHLPFVSLSCHPRVTAHLCGWPALDDALAGIASFQRADEAPCIDELILASDVVATVRAAFRCPEDDRPLLVLTGPSGTGKRSLVAAVAAEHGRSTLVVQCASLPADAVGLRQVGEALYREGKLTGAAIMFEDFNPEIVGAAPHGLASLLDDPTVIVAFSENRPAPSVAWRPGRSRVHVALALPTAAQREAAWRERLDGLVAPVELARLSDARVGVGIIDRVARSVLARHDSRPVSPRDITAAMRAELDDSTRGIGQVVETSLGWQDLVVPAETQAELDELRGRIRWRRRLRDEWGFGRKLDVRSSISALFSGPPGTGKTMAAGLIAAELGLAVLHIDVSMVVSKWVGETEKNLGRVFDAAEAGQVVLLFDEADALFGKRGEVRSANDRHANLEIGYLLQRIEAFHGIVMLTTNFAKAIDEAFARRLTAHVRFEAPGPEERRRLWSSMLPVEAPLGDDIDLGVVADRFDFAGGHIRNSVLRAACLACAENAPISQSHLLRAAGLQAASIGRVVAQPGSIGGHRHA